MCLLKAAHTELQGSPSSSSSQDCLSSRCHPHSRLTVSLVLRIRASLRHGAPACEQHPPPPPPLPAPLHPHYQPPSADLSLTSLLSTQQAHQHQLSLSAGTSAHEPPQLPSLSELHLSSSGRVLCNPSVSSPSYINKLCVSYSTTTLISEVVCRRFVSTL